jgi:DNA-directed RNA polymerase subunit L
MKESAECISGNTTKLTNSPDVEYCGYSAPHPSETKIHLRIQMYGESPLSRQSGLNIH